MAKKLNVEIVSAESAIYSGQGLMVIAPGESGELGILPGHTPLLTRIRPGTVRIQLDDGKEELIYVSGGIMEVQPSGVTVLADTSVRADNLDEAKSLEAKRSAEETLNKKVSEWERAAAVAELAQATAQLAAIKKLRVKR